MNSNIINVRKKYLAFILTIVITIIVSQIVIQYDISSQYKHASLVNIAGKQRMLSQRIANIAFSIHYDLLESGLVDQAKLDSLQLNCERISKSHEKLLLQAGFDQVLLKKNTPRIKRINDAVYKIITHTDSKQVTTSLNIISQNEGPFLFTMDEVVNKYNRYAEKKLDALKIIEIILAIGAILILTTQFIILFLPAIKALQQKLQNFMQQADSLRTLNEDLQERQEDNQVNLEYITTLQEHLESREKQFRELVEDASDMIYELDENGKFSYTNPVTENITGYTADELRSFYYYDIVHPSFLKQTIDFYKKQLKSRQEISYLELQIISKSGDYYWIGQNARMFFNENHVSKVSVVARDITDLVKAREALSQSEERFRSLAEHAPVGIFQMDEKGNATFLNKRWCEISGMEETEALGSGWINNIFTPDKNKVLHGWLEAVEEEREFLLEFRFINPKHGVRWVIGQASRVLSTSGKLIGFIGTTHDVTELKEIQIKLEINEKLYRELSENSLDLTTLSNSDGVLTYISNSSDKLLGYPAHEMIHKNFFSLVHPDDLEKVQKHWSRVIKKESVGNIEFKILTSDNNFIWVDSLMQVIHANKNDNAPLAIQINSRDITMRKKFEQEIHEAKTKAEEATKAKSNFLSMMSHEIRTPMNAIIGLTNILLEDNPRNEQKDNLRLLKFSGENLLTIINDILDFSKIEAGKIEIEKISFNMQEMLSNIISMLKQRATEKRISLNLIFSENVPPLVVGDPVRITQIISNLLSNAIKFTEKGKVDLTVSLEKRNADELYIKFQVTDTGIGIEKEKVEKIFESFSQAGADTTRKFGGTGLGLSITKLLLNLMGTDIQVESTYGVGSSFYFTLGLKEGIIEEKVDLPENNQIVLKDTPIRILLVEDNNVNQIVACSFLRKWGMITDVATNGLEAVKLIESKKYDIILMDLQMPEMDGYEATRVIRQKEDTYFKQVPILALTASAMLDIKDKVVETGMNDFVSKPFQPDELKQKIVYYASLQTAETKDAVLAK